MALFLYFGDSRVCGVYLYQSSGPVSGTGDVTEAHVRILNASQRAGGISPPSCKAGQNSASRLATSRRSLARMTPLRRDGA